jgi:hypothetical protein
LCWFDIVVIFQDVSAGSTGGFSVLSEAPVPGHESPCCKDADQPSPISVLDPSFTDDLSSCSECFGSVSADLQGKETGIDFDYSKMLLLCVDLTLYLDS